MIDAEELARNVFVLMHNDYPLGVYGSEKEAAEAWESYKLSFPHMFFGTNSRRRVLEFTMGARAR